MHSDLFSLRNKSAIYLPDNIERAVQLSVGGVAKQHPVKGGSTDLQAILRDGGAYFEVGGGAENKRRRRELVGGSWGILPQKILKSRVSEIVFTAFSARYFLK